MAVIEKIQDINNRVAEIIRQQEQLKSQAKNWENLYKEATDIQKRLIEQSTENAKKNDSLNQQIAGLKSDIETREKHQKDFGEKHQSLVNENSNLSKQLLQVNNELQAWRIKEEQQLSMHFGVEKEQEQLKALTDDLKEQLFASQQLNHELQTALQEAKITMVEEQAQANIIAQQKSSLEKEVSQLKEKFQNEISELHSKNSLNLDQLEKLQLENRKLQDEIVAINQSESEKLIALETLNGKIEEMEAQMALPPAPDNEDFYTSRIAQLNAQISNMEFEKELMKKNMVHVDPPQPAKIADISNQGSGSNTDQVHFLYAELQASQMAKEALEKQIHNYIEIIASQNKREEMNPLELKNLQEQNKIVKLAEAIEGNTVASNIELKQKLNEMIKEVDRCIAKLSS